MAASAVDLAYCQTIDETRQLLLAMFSRITCDSRSTGERASTSRDLFSNFVLGMALERVNSNRDFVWTLNATTAAGLARSTNIVECVRGHNTTPYLFTLIY